VQTRCSSARNFGDAQKQGGQDLCSSTDCQNCSKIDESCEISEDSESMLANGRIQPGEVTGKEARDIVNELNVEVPMSLMVNRDAAAESASNFSALHSKQALSDDTRVDGMQAERWISVENSTIVESQKNEAFDSIRQHAVPSTLFNTDAVECTPSVHEGESNCLNDVEQLNDRETYRFHEDQVVCKSSDFLPANSGQDVVPQKANKVAEMLDNSASEVKKTDVLSEISEAIVREVISGAVDCEKAAAALADGDTCCLSRQEIISHAILDSGDNSVLASGNSRLSNGDRKVDNFSEGKRGQDLEVGVPGGVSGLTNSDEVRDVSTDFVAPRVVKSAPSQLVIRCEDAECRADQDNNITEVGAHTVVPDHHSIEQQRSEIATNIENLEAWFRSADAEVQSKTASDVADLPPSAVEQYADELLKNRLELDRLDTSVRELEKFERDVCRDERYRLVYARARLHGLGATVNSIASKTVCISYRQSRYVQSDRSDTKCTELKKMK